MSQRIFQELLRTQWYKDKFLCIGLDSGQCASSTAIVEATQDLVCAYKLNLAFYRAGELKKTIRRIHQICPDVPVIIDAKVADVEHASAAYAQILFDDYGADALTVNPYLGRKAVKPFLDREDKGIFVLCHTSNPGAEEFQDVVARIDGDEARVFNAMKAGFTTCTGCGAAVPLYSHIAYQVHGLWNRNDNCGLVMGATYPEQLTQVHNLVGASIPILFTGIGKQGGKVRDVAKLYKDHRGLGMIISVGRSVTMASNGPDFVDAARREAIKLRDEINRYR